MSSWKYNARISDDAGRTFVRSPRRQLEDQLRHEMCWIISTHGEDGPLFFNLRNDWVDGRHDATHYTAAQRAATTLPDGCRWEKHERI
jgi:hypothetical protein